MVHEYEQIGRSKKSRVAVNPKAELEETARYLKAKLESLEKELAELREGPFGPNSEFMQSLPPEEREIALEALRKDREGRQDDLDDADTTELDQLMEDQDLEADDVDGSPAPQVILKHTEEHQAYVRNFNAILKEVVTDPIPTKAKKIALWRSYQRCRHHVQGFSSLVSAQIWDVLWQSQTEPHDSHRTTKTLVLAKDMLSQSSLSLTPEQLLVYMECLRLEKYLGTALQCWDENRSTLGPNAQVAKRFWALGVQLYSDNDQPEEAQNIAMQCLKHGSFADATILVPVIISWARKGTVNSLEKAWACYLRFLVELGAGIRSEDYESISTALLNQGQPDMALAVFRDLTLDKVTHRNHDSVHAFRRLVGFVGELQSSAIDEHEVSKVSLTALTVLPRFLQNKYFYAAWIKRLIGLGDVDAASNVVELMYERGFKPDARHLNGIVGAWIRDGSAGARAKAEQLGWSMINARVDFVRHRAMSANGQESITSSEDPTAPEVVVRPVPPATIETFSVLLLYYTRGCQDDMAEKLMKVMTDEAMIAPNAFIWNHWLYASLRVKDLQSVWIQYQAMRQSVQPDLETFACLWDTAKVQWDPSRSAHSAHIPTARKLYQEMNDWMLQLPAAPLIRAKQEFSRELHEQIIRVFCLSQDLRGTLCALHGLKQLFGEYPDSATSRIIVILIARLLPRDPNHPPSGCRDSSRRTWPMVSTLSAVQRILQIVSDQRTLALMDSGVEFQDLDEAAQKQFQLDVLSDLLVVVLKRAAAGRTGDVENEVKQLAALMGVDVGGVDFRKDELFA